jgi:hypothetical protein
MLCTCTGGWYDVYSQQHEGGILPVCQIALNMAACCGVQATGGEQLLTRNVVGTFLDFLGEPPQSSQPATDPEV